jgi:hypothetical protein
VSTGDLYLEPVMHVPLALSLIDRALTAHRKLYNFQ